MRVTLFVPCFIDSLYPNVGMSMVRILERLGHTVEFPEDQTCCGQPAFNCGDWPASREVMRHTTRVFEGDKQVIVPSGSCAAMLFHGAPLEFEKEKDLPTVQKLANRTWELADFLVNGLGIEKWPGRFPARIAFHRACHTRGTGSGEAALKLLQSIDGLEVIPFGEAEQCCGFGGTFSVSFPHVSSSMGCLKLEHMTAVNPDFIVSGDMSCLMHLGGLADRGGQPVKTLHFVQILQSALHRHG